jgi:hypothetical protein
MIFFFTAAIGRVLGELIFAIGIIGERPEGRSDRHAGLAIGRSVANVTLNRHLPAEAPGAPRSFTTDRHAHAEPGGQGCSLPVECLRPSRINSPR